MLQRFLYHDAAERERLLDLSMRLRSTYALAVALMVVPVLLGMPVYGWVASVPLALSAVAFLLLTARLDRRRRPDLLLLASCSFALVMMLACIWLADGPKEFLFPMPAFVMIGMAPVFARRVSVTAAVLTSVGLVAVGLGSYGEEVRAMPPFLILPITLLFVTLLATMASRDAEHLNRNSAIVDPLTGLLNRIALQSRATEMAVHARRAGEQVALVIVDIDHFKSVNDIHGHATGDAVLVEVAARLRAELGSAGTLFRFGGEEFVVLLASSTPIEAVAWAERLREVIRIRPVVDVALSASFGVAVSSPDETFDYRELFVLADDALYRAKQTGRDRVCAASDHSPLTAVESVPSSSGADPVRASSVEGPRPELAPVPAEARAADAPRAADGNWLVADAVERAHIVDLLERSRLDGQINSAIALVALLISGFWIGWWLLVPPVIAGIVWDVVTSRMPRSRRPEYAALGGLLLIIIATGMAMVIADSDNLFGLPLVALTVFGACATFTQRGALVIAIVAVLSVVIPAVLVNPAMIVANPVSLAFPVALVGACAVVGEAMGRSARQHRLAAVTDTLTGVLNRAALEARIPELEQQAATSPAPTSLLVVDIDHFKRVNDLRGHEVGDLVLAEVAARLRTAVRPFDSVYRVGGEEFVVVLVDMAAGEAALVAEAARVAVQHHPVDGPGTTAGVGATVSIGVATAEGGNLLDYDALFGAADRRLYAAKRHGRNRVVTGDALEPVLHAA